MVFDFPCHKQFKRRLASKQHFPLQFFSLFCEAHPHSILSVVPIHHLHQLSVFNLCIQTKSKKVGLQRYQAKDGKLRVKIIIL